MKLYDFKHKWLLKLGLYHARSDNEQQLVNNLVYRINDLLTKEELKHIAVIISVSRFSSISDELKSLLEEMLNDLGEIDGM